MGNYFTDNEDLLFYFDHDLPWADVVALTERGPERQSTDDARAMYRDVLAMVGDFIATDIAPHVRELDDAGLGFKDGEVIEPKRLAGLVKKMNQLELHKMCLPKELGGLDCPFLVYLACCEMFSRADPAVMTHFGFHGGIAMALMLFSIREGTTKFDAATGQITETRWRAAIDEIAAGKAWGSMDITEPDCGSDMASIKTRAVFGPDGVWRLTGQKIFITSGHGKYHVVIARSGRDAALGPAKGAGEAGAGLDDLALFLVPAYSDGPTGLGGPGGPGGKPTRVRHAKLLRSEEKLGHHASATMVVSFEDTPGELIGKAGEGFKHMLTMMNNARVGVGFEAIGVCEQSYRLAAEYAAQRRSMGKTIDRHELIADYLDEMKHDVVGLRALAMRCAVHEEFSQKLELQTHIRPSAPPALALHGDQRHHQRRARELTPLLKYLSAEKAVESARRCLQIHGGVGYTKDYLAEKLLRDAVVIPIYEGTSQIQALMVMKDRLGDAIRAPQEFVKREAQARWRSLSARDGLERQVARLETIGIAAMRHLLVKTASNKLRALRGQPVSNWAGALRHGWDPKRDFAWALLHAERLTRILADHAVADALWQQVKRHPERTDRRETLEAHLERAEPRARQLLEMITTTGGRLLGKLAESGAERREVS